MHSNSKRDGMTHAERAAAGATAGDIARRGNSVEVPRESASDRRTARGPVVETVEQMLTVLTWCTANDRIPRGRLEAEAWLAALPGFTLHELKTAITIHYRHSTWEIKPAHITQIIDEGIDE